MIMLIDYRPSQNKVEPPALRNLEKYVLWIDEMVRWDSLTDEQKREWEDFYLFSENKREVSSVGRAVV